MLIDNCTFLFSNLEEFKLYKIRRSQNCCANVLAKQGRFRKSKMRIFLEPPHFVRKLSCKISGLHKLLFNLLVFGILICTCLYCLLSSKHLVISL